MSQREKLATRSEGQLRRASRRRGHFMESWRSRMGGRGENVISHKARERKVQTACWLNGKKFHVVGEESMGKHRTQAGRTGSVFAPF